MVAALSQAPERRCALTRERADKATLIRFVRSPDGAATPDLGEKLPGRGVWLQARANVIEEAVRKNVFARGFKQATAAPNDLVARLQAGLEERLIGLCGLARRAGEFVNGLDDVREALKSGRAALLFEASDGASDGRDRVFRAARACAFDGKVIGLFDARRMGLAVGRDNVVHGALLHGGLAAKAARETERLAGFRPLAPADWRSAASETGAPVAASATVSVGDLAGDKD